AAQEVLDFYRNYHSCRFVGDLLVLRLQVTPNHQELAELNKEFKDIVVSGTIRTASPFPPERSDHDQLDLKRIALRFDRVHYGRLRQLIDALNRCTG
ncbi:MAG: Rossman fold protein, TIGR00730 family, partial [Acidimicrobiales bacterium]